MFTCLFRCYVDETSLISTKTFLKFYEGRDKGALGGITNYGTIWMSGAGKRGLECGEVSNSKHWFTTSFLQPLPYLVTPETVS